MLIFVVYTEDTIDYDFHLSRVVISGLHIKFTALLVMTSVGNPPSLLLEAL